MSKDDLSIIAIDFRNPVAALMAQGAFYGTLYGNNNIPMALCFGFLNRHIRDIEGNFKGFVHYLTLFLSGKAAAYLHNHLILYQSFTPEDPKEPRIRSTPVRSVTRTLMLTFLIWRPLAVTTRTA